MNKELKAIFAPLAARIHQMDPDITSLMMLIGGFCGTSPSVAQALCYHTKDYMMERQGEMTSYSSIMVEAYWRTFFDPVLSKKYTTGIEFTSNEHYQQFVTYMVSSMDMEEQQHAAGSFHESSPANKQ